jgi:hypothetical protein
VPSSIVVGLDRCCVPPKLPGALPEPAGPPRFALPGRTACSADICRLGEPPQSGRSAHHDAISGSGAECLSSGLGLSSRQGFSVEDEVSQASP